MSTSIVQIADVKGHQLQRDWAAEKLSHIASVLKYRYGIEASPANTDNSYALSLIDEQFKKHARVSYTFIGIIKSDVRDEALIIAKRFVSNLPVDGNISTEFDTCSVAFETWDEGALRYREPGSNLLQAEYLNVSESWVRRKLAFERLAHISSILEYRYGVNIQSENDKYPISATDMGVSVELRYWYNTNDLLESTAEQEALFLRKFFVRCLA